MSWAADAYLMKSSDLTELKAMIRHLLERERRGSSRSNALKMEIHRNENQRKGDQTGQLLLLH